MIKPSPEIEAVIVRWLAAHSGKNSRPLTNMLSISEHLRYLGSAPGEYWAGSLLRRGLARHLSEVPDWTATGAVIEGFENGETGWGAWRGELTFAGRNEVLEVRFSLVLTLEEGLWHIVQVHCSMAYPNLEFSGIEHNAFAQLIQAAMEGHEGIGGEGSAVIMFTDVANSTEIANAVGDRDWAVAIGRQRDAGCGGYPSACAASVTEPHLKLRIGIHAGDVVQTGGDFFGTVVNKASRITALAQPNEVLVSDVARAMTGERSEFAFGDPLIVALRGGEGLHSISNLKWSL
ncbi:MAG: nuclear transport factor 2 family protein [Alphaproteobacteria bacterium]